MIGFINIYKPQGMTSSSVVQKIKKKFHIDKIGHMGTLDPMASGLLPIAIGKATRLFDYMLDKKKVYNVIFDFGYETDTLDTTGTKIYENNVIFDNNTLEKAVNMMCGKQTQMPPKYSAKNVNGSRAYTLARAGVDFELKPKEIEIYKFEIIEKIDQNKYKFRIECSSGTYIRAIGRDLAKIIGTYATMSYLERCDVGYFQIDNSYNLDEILQSDNLEKYVVSPLIVLKNFDIINIDNNTYKDLLNGKFVEYNKIENNSFVVMNGKLIGVCKPRENQLKLDCYLEENI